MHHIALDVKTITLKNLTRTNIIKNKIDYDITDQCISSLRYCRNLSLRGCHNITNQNIKFLKNCHTLNLSQCQNIIDPKR